jgi:hypothetical protein
VLGSGARWSHPATSKAPAASATSKAEGRFPMFMISLLLT